MDEAQVERQLCREGTRGELGQSEAVLLLGVADPAPGDDEITLHVSGEGDRSPEADGAET